MEATAGLTSTATTTSTANHTRTKGARYLFSIMCLYVYNLCGFSKFQLGFIDKYRMGVPNNSYRPNKQSYKPHHSRRLPPRFIRRVRVLLPRLVSSRRLLLHTPPPFLLLDPRRLHNNRLLLKILLENPAILFLPLPQRRVLNRRRRHLICAYL